MTETFLPSGILLEPEHLIIISLQTSDNLIVLKVYEWDYFFSNPNPLDNQEQIAEYSVHPKCFKQMIYEIQKLFLGWKKIDKEQTIKLIGIHNQDPKSLFIQFSLSQRFFIYQRKLDSFQETVLEELFGKKDRFRLRPLNPSDEKYLISNLKFIPKSKKAISFYPQSSHGYTLIRRKKCLP